MKDLIAAWKNLYPEDQLILALCVCGSLTMITVFGAAIALVFI